MLMSFRMCSLVLFFFEMYISTYDCVLKHGKCGHFFYVTILKKD
jgi:hypothetical protein